MKSAATDSKPAVYLSWAIAGVLALLPFHAFLTTWLGSNTGNLDLWVIWKEVILAITAPLAVLIIWRSEPLRKRLLRWWIVRLFGLYIGLHLVLGAWAMASGRVEADALAHSFIINLRIAAFFIVCVAAASGSDFLKRHWLKILLLPALLVLLFGLAQKLILPQDFLRHFGYSPDTVPAYQAVDSNIDYSRVQSTLRGANPLGAYLVIIISALVVGLRKRRVRQATGLLLSLTILFYSYSRSAWIGTLLAAGLLAYLLAERSRKLTGPLLVTGLAAIFIVSGLYSLRDSSTIQNTLLHTSQSSTSAKSSNQVRLEAIKEGVGDIIDDPAGQGPGTAGPASFRNGSSSPRIAENYYIQIAQEVGVLGLVIFAAINAFVAKELWHRRRDNLALMLLASLVGLSFVNLVSHAWADDTLSYIWWGLAGIALAPAILKPRHKQDVQDN